MLSPKNILLIRLSAIGDIIVCSPVIRAIRKQFPDAQIHILTKKSMSVLWEHRPEIDKVHIWNSSIYSTWKSIRENNFDCIVDLQKNTKTRILKYFFYSTPYFSFSKINFLKWQAVQFKKIQVLPNTHIVDRMFSGLSALNIQNDNAGLDIYIPESIQNSVKLEVKKINSPYTVIVLGGTYFTKRVPTSKWLEILSEVKGEIIALGGPQDVKVAEKLKIQFPSILNKVGELNLMESFAYISNSKAVITGDTGLMHAAAAFQKPICSIWGNTIPEFGLYPYYKKNSNINSIQINQMPECKPCSKIGYDICPKGHFACMMNIDPIDVANWQSKVLEESE